MVSAGIKLKKFQWKITTHFFTLPEPALSSYNRTPGGFQEVPRVSEWILIFRVAAHFRRNGQGSDPVMASKGTFGFGSPFRTIPYDSFCLRERLITIAISSQIIKVSPWVIS